MHEYAYTPRGVCSQRIRFTLDNGKLRDVSFTGGCDGNLKGLSRLVAGMDIDTVIERVRDVRCENKPTSCPAQLALALREAHAAGQGSPV